MDAGTLHTEIAKVCPLTGCRVGVADDRTTWSFDPVVGTSQTKIDAGNNVIATIPVDFTTPVPPAPEDVALFSHENRLRAIEGKPPLVIGDFLDKMKTRSL